MCFCTFEIAIFLILEHCVPVSVSLEADLEEDIRKYLSHKPMTTMNLLRKIMSKKTDLSKEVLMPLIVDILKRINPHKQKVKGIMHLSLKTRN